MLGLISHVLSRVIVAMQLRALGSIFALLLVPACTDSVIGAAPTGVVAEAIITAQRDASLYPESVTVKVNNAANDYCTGTIIAPRVVLTAAHCVIFNTGGANNWTVTAPFPTTSPQTRTVTQWEEIDANFPRTGYDDQDTYRDIGFLYPDTGFTGVAFPILSRTASATATNVSAVGRRSASATAGLALSTATKLLAADAGYPNDYQTARLTDGGDSGGGLFLDGTHDLIGAERVFDPDTVKDFWVEYAGATYDTILAKIAAHGGYMTLAPSAPKVGPLGTQAITVTVGGGGTYTYAVTANNSGSATVSATGVYRAGIKAGATDVVTVTDSRGHSGTLSIAVGAAVSITPAMQTVAPRGKITFSAKDGSGGGYVYSLGTNRSGATLSGASYTAGTTGSVNDIVHVVDANGGAADATVSVTAGLSLSPANPSTPAKGQIALTALGGSGSGYSWKLTTGPSGGSVDATGHYTAGATSLVTDEVTVTDSLGNARTVEIPVGYPLMIRDSGTVPPRGNVELVGIGGSGTGYAWTITENNSGATIDANGNYVAGTKGDVHDVITLADSTGTVVTGEESIGPVLAITPGDASVTAGGTLTFTATGGSGAGYTFTLDAAPSGGTIDGALYTAGTTADVSDLVVAHDPLGNTAVTHVAVVPAPIVDAGAPAATPAASDSGCSATGHGSADGGLAVALGALLVLRSRRRRRA